LALGVSLAVMLAAASVFGIVAGISRVAKGAKVANIGTVRTDDGFIVSTDGGTKLMNLTTAEEDDSESDENVYTITATVKDINGNALIQYQDVTYSMAWATAKSDKVTDYVTMTTNGTSATFTCLQPFDTQIVVTCTSNQVTSISATATLDYYQRMETLSDSSDTWEHVGYTLENGENPTQAMQNTYTCYTDPSFGVGSIDNSVENYEIKITATKEFVNILAGMGGDINPVYSFEGDSAIGQLELAEKLLTTTLSNVWTCRWYYQQAVTKTSDQLTIEITVTPKYGAVQTYTKSVNIVFAEAELASLSLDSVSHIY
jgi:hypothetical protein